MLQIRRQLKKPETPWTCLHGGKDLVPVMDMKVLNTNSIGSVAVCTQFNSHFNFKLLSEPLAIRFVNSEITVEYICIYKA